MAAKPLIETKTFLHLRLRITYQYVAATVGLSILPAGGSRALLSLLSSLEGPKCENMLHTNRKNSKSS